MSREPLRSAKRWVVKVGSALLTDVDSGLNAANIRRCVDQIVALQSEGVGVVLVSSGSIVEGMQRLGWRRRPRALHQLQAAAAVGQMGLIQMYETVFQQHGRHTAQVLLTHADLANRVRYLNARSTLRTLLALGVVPVVNENDTVVTDEIRFGDNDTLAALVTNLVEAEVLVILTDQAGLYNADPRHRPDAQLIADAEAGDPRLVTMAGAGSVLGRGGMVTKIKAAEKAARSGATTIIASGVEPDVLQRLRAGADIGTMLSPKSGRLAARKQWLAGQLNVRGRVCLDAGAVRVLRESGRSLLPVGVTAVHGDFSRGELVSCTDAEGAEIARGLVNYSSGEAVRIIGEPSERIEAILGYVDEPELIHRDNMVVL